MSALRQLRLIIIGATIGAIGGSIVLRTSDDLRPAAVALAAGAIFLGVSVALERFARRRGARLAPVYASLLGRVMVTLAAALSVVLVLNLMVASDASSVPARRDAHPTVAPVPAASSQIAGPTNSVDTVAPVLPPPPHQVVRPPDATQPTSSAPRATAVPASSPAATSPVSPFATPRPSSPAPPPSAATAAPAQSVAPVTPQQATPQPTPVSSPPSIIPTLPPLPTSPIRLP